MSKLYALPQLSGNRLFLTDSGCETTLVFHERIALPHFSVIHLMRDAAGRNWLTRYYERHLDIAREAGFGFILEAPTWRGSIDWCAKLGLSGRGMIDINRASIHLLRDIKQRRWSPLLPIVISGCVGPRGDGYVAGEAMTIDEARGHHALQIATMAAAGAEMIGAMTMTNVEEAAGIAHAALDDGMPVAISFTLETDGRLPSGISLRDAINAVDDATSGWVSYYMINCAHPDHLEPALAEGEPWVRRIRGLRANASRRSHAELDQATKLDDGDPIELAQQYRHLRQRFPNISVVGGCCGTDHRHVRCIADAMAETV